jgi:hypothetical protein
MLRSNTTAMRTDLSGDVVEEISSNLRRVIHRFSRAPGSFLHCIDWRRLCYSLRFLIAVTTLQTGRSGRGNPSRLEHYLLL